MKAAKDFALQTGQTLEWYYANDSYKRKPIEDDNLIDTLCTLHSSETNQ